MLNPSFMAKKVVFLDFDGVLIPMRGKLSAKDFHPDCVGGLNLILTVSGAGIVVCSSWRHDVGRDMLGTLLDNGISIDPTMYLGFTPDDPEDRRGYEIARWIEQHQFSGEFVILDDDDQMEPVQEHLVPINADDGLTKENVVDALAILMEE